MQCKFLSFLLIKKFFLGVLGIRDKSTLLPDSDIHHHSQFRCHTSHILTLPVHCVSPPSQSLTRITTTTGMFEQTMFVWMCSVFRLRLESSEREMIHSNGVQQTMRVTGMQCATDFVNCPFRQSDICLSRDSMSQI